MMTAGQQRTSLNRNFNERFGVRQLSPRLCITTSALPVRKRSMENKFFLGPVKFVRLILRCLVPLSRQEDWNEAIYGLGRVTLCQCSYRILSSLGSVSRDNAKACSRDQKDSFKNRSAGP